MLATSMGAVVDVLAFVIGSRETGVALELVDGSFGGVAVPVSLGIEGWRAPTLAPAVGAVLLLVSFFRDGRGDPPPAKETTNALGGVGLVGQY